MKERIEELIHRRIALIGYLRAMVDAEDWHAVSDAACDLREVEVEVRALQRALGQLYEH